MRVDGRSLEREEAMEADILCAEFGLGGSVAWWRGGARWGAVGSDGVCERVGAFDAGAT
jgi:hypothetical protein